MGEITAEEKGVVFTVSYDEKGNIVNVKPAPGYKIVSERSFPSEIERTTILHANTTIIQHTSSSPDCWWIIDLITGKLTKVCR
jgi:hypothetical protein